MSLPNRLPLGADKKTMIDFSQDYFALFGLPPRYRFDADQLDLAYRALQREIHPDRYATGDEAERRLALQSSARVNEAYRALKDPVGRAQYLLSLRGIDALAETNTALPAEFLQHELERREGRTRRGPPCRATARGEVGRRCAGDNACRTSRLGGMGKRARRRARVAI